jgi:hypothetical protein
MDVFLLEHNSVLHFAPESFVFYFLICALSVENFGPKSRMADRVSLICGFGFGLAVWQANRPFCRVIRLPGIGQVDKGQGVSSRASI